MFDTTEPSLTFAQLQGLRHPVDLGTPVLNQRLAQPRQVAEIADLQRRHETPPEQPALQKLREPLAVPHVRLAPGNVLHMPGVDQEQAEVALQHRVHRAPVHARRLHRSVGHAGRGQPRP